VSVLPHNNNNRRVEEDEEEGDGRAEVPRLPVHEREKKKHLKNQGDFPGKKNTNFCRPAHCALKLHTHNNARRHRFHSVHHPLL
jgi:hypothetical protein